MNTDHKYLDKKFRALNDNERELLAQQIRRNRVVHFIANGFKKSFYGTNDMMVAYTQSECGKWTYAVLELFPSMSLQPSKEAATAYTFVGAAKRLTYEPMKDEQNVDTGKNIAFCRALTTPPIESAVDKTVIY